MTISSLTRRAALFAALLALPVAAQNLAEFEKKITEFKLANGMKFIVLERHDAPVIAFNAFVNAGSADDPNGMAGMAHMFEHMIGKGIRSVGSKDWAAEEKALERIEQLYDKMQAARQGGNAEQLKTVEADLKDAIASAEAHVDPNAYVRAIEEQGGVGFNAGTASDYTNYFYSLPSNKLELWFLMSSEFFKQPVFRQFYKERDVVLEERRMRVESDPQGKLIETVLHTAFEKHPYREGIGPAEEISNLRAKDARAFFQKYYVPGNVTVAVVGDVDPARVKQMAQKYFGDIKPGPMPPPVDVAEPKQEKERRVAMQLEAQPMLVMAYRRPDQRHPDDPVLDVIQGILSGGRTGWLYRDLVQKERSALGVQAIASFPSGKYANLFLFFGLPNAGRTVQDVEKGIESVVNRLTEQPVDAATLQRIKTKVRAGLIRQLDSNSGLASQLPFYEAMYGDWRMMFRGLQDIEKVTAEDVQRVAKTYFVPSSRTVVYTEQPKGAAK
ncbi:MAG TPA: pitrilysin family protein [Bryobacteraceae bacterium]|nr:pitrilysin family protein [Bryobacteraceae bacterium]